MGQKVRADALRLNLNKDWDSMWFAEGEEYRRNLHEDINIRDYVTQRLKSAGLDTVEISRSSSKITVNVFVARPGVAIGRGGEGIEQLKTELNRKFGRKDIEIKINEVRKPELSAKVVAQNIATGLEKRQSPKRLMIGERDRVMQAGAVGVKIWISGDFGIPKQSRTLKIEEGSIPLQKLRADIDFANEEALIRNAGKHGVKVWIYRETKEGEDDSSEAKSNRDRSR